MLSDGKGEILDKEWFDFSTEMYAEGHSFFTYISDSADSLASCCFTGDQKVVIKVGQDVLCITFKELYSRINSKEIGIFKILGNNGKWEDGDLVHTTSTNLYKITLEDDTYMTVTNDHEFPTVNGDIKTSNLEVGDSLLINTTPLKGIYLDSNIDFNEGVFVGLYYLFGKIISNRSEGDTFIQLNIPSCINNESLMFSINNVANKYRGYVDIKYNSDPILSTDSINVKTDHFYNILTYYTVSMYNNNPIINNRVLLAPIQFRVGIIHAFSLIKNKDNIINISGINIGETISLISTSLGLYSNCLENKPNELHIPHSYNDYLQYHVLSPDVKESIKIKEIEYLSEDERLDVYCFKMLNEYNPYFVLPNGVITHNCRLRNKLMDNTFSFTNGLQGISTGSKSVITLNMNRIVQNFVHETENGLNILLNDYLINILDRVYKYHTAYNELLWDLYNDKMLSVYSAGYINLNQQYLTIGVNGINEAAMFLGMECTNNDEYMNFCDYVLSTIKEENKKHKSKKCIFNTEIVPKRGGHFKPLLIDLKLLEIGQQGASKIYICAA